MATISPSTTASCPASAVGQPRHLGVADGDVGALARGQRQHPAVHGGDRADAVPLELVAPAVVVRRRQLPGGREHRQRRRRPASAGRRRRGVQLADVPGAVVQREERVAAGEPAAVEGHDDVPVVPLLGGVAAGVPDRDVPPPYSPAAIVPVNDAYSSGWSSVGTASRLPPGSGGGPLGTAQLFRTPSRSSRRSQCTRSPVRPRGRVVLLDDEGVVVARGQRLPAARHRLGRARRVPLGAVLGERVAPGRAAAARQALRRARLAGGLSAVGSSSPPAFFAAASCGAVLAARLGRRAFAGAAFFAAAFFAGAFAAGGVVRAVVGVVRGAAAGALDAAPQRAHQVDDRGAVVGRPRAPAAPRRRSAWPPAARSWPRGSRR